MAEQDSAKKTDEFSKEYWEKEKARLESQKLQIELNHYERQLQLQEQKLASDLKEWRIRTLIAIVTAIATGFGFFLGNIYQNSSEEKKEQFQISLERERTQNEEYNKNLASLSSANPGEREAAAANLAWYVRGAQKVVDSSKENQITRQLAEHRIEQVFSAASVRLPSETDTAVMEEYSQLFVAAPNRALPYVVAVNTRAGAPLVRAAASYVAWNIAKPSDHLDGCDREEPEILEQLGNLSELVVRTPMPFEGATYDGKPVTPKFSISPLLKGRLHTEYAFECRRAMALSAYMKDTERIQERIKNLDQLTQAAKVMSVTSITLTEILSQLSERLDGADLNEILIVTGNLDNLNLSGAKLQRAYINGLAKSFICDRCDFFHADLSKFHLSAPCSLRKATFEGVPKEVLSGMNVSLCDQ